MTTKEHKNPIPVVDTIIQKNDKILFVQRKKDPFKDHFVFPGGFVNEGETIENAAVREVKEETSLEITLENILGVYSDPKRDPRGHMITTVFIGSLKSSNDQAIAGDDANTIKWVDIKSISSVNLGFDHNHIISDYIKWTKEKETFWSTKIT